MALSRFPTFASDGYEVEPTPEDFNTVIDAVNTHGTSISTLGTSKADLALSAWGKRALSYPDHLDRWRYKLASARFQQPVVMCCGDSITAGAYANNVSSTDAAAQALWAERSWVPQLRALFADRYGDPGEGIILGNDPRVTNSGATNAVSLGVAGQAKILDTTDTLTYALPACTDIVIHAWWNSGSDVFSYELDGGAAVTTSASSGDQPYTVTVSGLSNTTHTLVLRFAGAAGKYSVISGVSAQKQTSAGVRVHRAGISGAWLESYWNTTGTNLTKMCQVHFDGPGTDLAIIAFGTNDGSSTGQSAGVTPASFRARLETVVTNAVAAGADVLLLAVGERLQTTLPGPYYPADFFTEMDDLASATDHVAYMDIGRVWGTYAEASALGLMHDSSGHPSLTGHSDFAKLVYEAIGGV